MFVMEYAHGYHRYYMFALKDWSDVWCPKSNATCRLMKLFSNKGQIYGSPLWNEIESRITDEHNFEWQYCGNPIFSDVEIVMGANSHHWDDFDEDSTELSSIIPWQDYYICYLFVGGIFILDRELCFRGSVGFDSKYTRTVGVDTQDTARVMLAISDVIDLLKRVSKGV